VSHHNDVVLWAFLLNPQTGPPMSQLILEAEYQAFLTHIKQYYQKAQLKAAYAVNCEMIQFYWRLGQMIIEKKAQTAWGSNFLRQLSKDLQAEFPATKGFSVSNLERMRKFASLYPDLISAQAVRELPWGHIVVLMEQVKNFEAREWYANNALKNGIARSVLIIQIEQGLYERQGKHAHKMTNFAERLPSPQSDLAIQLFKDPYDFRFLPVTEEAKELEIENSMVNHLSKLFLELGTGFAYMGHQYPLTIEGTDYFLDMLFYNVVLRCYFVVEIKAVEVKPEHIGKLNFYLAVVDDVLKKPEDNPTIGLLLCKKKNKMVAEYALKRTDGAIGIAEYLLLHELPKDLRKKLPDTHLLEAKLAEKIESKEP
jgi:predicted nuclease of restriction endonuclease-like (RecB) superfamily